jgi:O-antigen ligase
VLAFVPGIAGAATSPRWALLAVIVPVATIFVTPRTWSVGHLLWALFLGWSALTLAWSAGPYEGIDALCKLILLAGVFCIGAELRSLRPVFIGLGLAFAVNSAITIAEFDNWYVVPAMVHPAGLFVNKNFNAEAAALVVVGLCAYRLWWLVPLVLPSLLLPGARGALVGVAVGGIVLLWQRQFRLTAAVLASCLWIAGTEMVHRYQPDSTIAQRVTLWREAATALTPFGHGLGSFFTNFPSHSSEQIARHPHAHNDLIEIAYETGIPGALLAGALSLWALGGRLLAERAVLAAFLAVAMFGFPFHLPVTATLAALVGGRLCARRSVVWRSADGRRMAVRLGPVAFRRPRRGRAPSAGGAGALPVRAAFPHGGSEVLPASAVEGLWPGRHRGDPQGA